MNISGSYIKGVLLVLLSALCFSISGTLQALAPEGSNPFIITEMRMIIGSLFLYFWCRAFKKLPHSYKDLPWKSLFICAIFLLIGQLCFFTGMANIGVAAGAVISIGSAPIFAAIISRIFFKIPPPQGLVRCYLFSHSGSRAYQWGRPKSVQTILYPDTSHRRVDVCCLHQFQLKTRR